MVYSLTYQRPAYVLNRGLTTLSGSSDEGFEKGYKSNVGSVRSGKSTATAGIPDALAFDKIVNGGTCPPCTPHDFMNYLHYIEHSAENLQFFLWYLDYVQRFKQVNSSDLALAPEWTRAQQDSALQAAQAQATAQKTRAHTEHDIFKGTDFDNLPKGVGNDSKDPFITPPRTPGDTMPNRKGSQPWDLPQRMSDYATSYSASNVGSYQQTVGEAFQSAGLKQPFSIQPFREEINRIISTYIANGAPRELNISDRERNALLRALEYTTHPSAFRSIYHTVEHSLRRQSHPNFIRWTICNGNRARVIFARGVGIGAILLGFVIAILLTLSRAERGWRAFAAIPWIIGVSTLVAAWKGMCVVLHGMHHRHLRPWELFENPVLEVELKNSSFDSFGSANSYEDEPWVIKYEKRNIIRKIFDREVWIQEPALRQIQDTIFTQSVLLGVLFAVIFTAVFVALPKRNFL